MGKFPRRALNSVLRRMHGFEDRARGLGTRALALGTRALRSAGCHCRLMRSPAIARPRRFIGEVRRSFHMAWATKATFEMIEATNRGGSSSSVICDFMIQQPAVLATKKVRLSAGWTNDGLALVIGQDHHAPPLGIMRDYSFVHAPSHSADLGAQ